MPTQQVSLQPIFTSVPRFAAMVGLSARFCWDLVHDELIPTVRVGRRVLVPIAKGARALEKLDGTLLHDVALPQPPQQAVRLSPRTR